MKAHYGFGITLLAGVALGAGAVSVLHAQATPPPITSRWWIRSIRMRT